jgi:hypothetical protein
MSVRISFRHTGMLLVGIQEAFVDSGWKIAGWKDDPGVMDALFC